MRWCLQNNAPSWDIFAACLLARSFGDKHVYFRLRDKMYWRFKDQVAWNRFRKLLVPIAEMWGLEWSLTREVPKNERSYNWAYGAINDLYSKHEILLLNPPRKPENYITLTLRTSKDQLVGRNSNLEVWETFQRYLEDKGHEVRVMKDDEDNPLPPKKRADIYANAYMNFSSNTGPMALCHFSTNIPYITTDMFPDNADGEKMRKHHEDSGFYGKQLAWANEDQRFIWRMSTVEMLVNCYEEKVRRTQPLEERKVANAC